MNCSFCHGDVPPGGHFCPTCGRPMVLTSAYPQESSYPQVALPGTSIDFRRLGRGDLIAGGGLTALFISLFLPWYTMAFSGSSLAISAVGSGAGGWRVLVLILCIGIAGYLFSRTIWRNPRLPIPHWQLLTVVCTLTALLTLVAFLVKPGSVASSLGVGVSWSYGAYVGLVAAVVAVAGAVQRSTQPEVIFIGGQSSVGDGAPAGPYRTPENSVGKEVSGVSGTSPGQPPISPTISSAAIPSSPPHSPPVTRFDAPESSGAGSPLQGMAAPPEGAPGNRSSMSGNPGENAGTSGARRTDQTIPGPG